MQDLRFRDLRFSVLGLGSRIEGLGPRVQDFGLRVCVAREP